MVNAVPNRLGQVNGAGDALALFKDISLGEVLTAYETKAVMAPLTAIRTIESGKSASFPATGEVTGSYHVPGAEITGGNAMNSAEIVVTVDGVLIAPQFVADIDEAMANYQVRQVISGEIGKAMAKIEDRQLLQMTVLAARATNAVTGQPGGGRIGTNTVGAPASAAYNTNGEHLAEAIALASRTLDEKDVPEDMRYCVVRPAQYSILWRAVRNINKDFGGQGSFAEGNILRVAGVDIIKSNNLPITDMSAAVGPETGPVGNHKYRGNFLNTTGVVFRAGCIGTVRLMGMAMDVTYDPRRLGTLMVAKQAQGHGIIRPAHAVEIFQGTV